MARKSSAENFSEEELHRLLVEKKKAAHEERLEHFRKTRRIVLLVPDKSIHGTREDVNVKTWDSSPFEEASTLIDKRRNQRKLIFDRFLFAIEIAAIFGLVFILLSGINIMRDLNHEVVSALKQPTLTPTPLIVAVVLPSGHTPPGAPGGAQPNDSEIPELLRPMVQSLANLPLPTQGPEQAGRIQIPAIGVDAPIVQGDGWEQLKKGVGQHVGTPNPGQPGNLVLSAHNDVFGEIFKDLDRLKAGDVITVYTNQRQYSYLITGSQIIAPTQVDVMNATEKASMTLISCYPFMVDNKRIAVSAVLQTTP